MTAPELAAAREDFPFEWEDPSDAELTWDWDDMHMPLAMTPLGGDYVRVLADGFAYRFSRLEAPFRIQVRVWNGYAYFGFEMNVPEAEREAFLSAYKERKRKRGPRTTEYWQAKAVPELREMYAWIEALPVETMPAPDLAEAWDGAWQRVARAWQIHFYAITGPYQVLDDLADFYEGIVPDAPPGEALRLVQGRLAELESVDAGLGRLTAMVTGSPELAALVSAQPPATLDELAAAPGGEAFVTELRALLREHGHLGQSFDDLSLASWEEEPALLLGEIAKRLHHPVEPAAERRARLVAEANALADAMRARLADRADELARFESLLALGREIGGLTETHNYWIDRKAQARLRALATRVGGRLAAAGVIDAADDVFYLRRDEVPGLLVSPEDRRGLVAERRAEHARQATVTPPRQLGKPEAFDGDRFDGKRFESTDERVLQGTGASAGIVQGLARVVLGPDDFDRVQPGDVIVAPSSNPSWVPLFAIAGGLCTNTGGVLSHAAVVAREFGLPAVVGLGDATTRITDGQTVELDGTSGIVRLL